MLKFQPYSDNWSRKFYDLNVVWLRSLFLIEPYDEYVLENPREAILDKGGSIYFGIYKGQAVATFAIVPTSEGRVELNKMAVQEDLRGQGFGNVMMSFVLEQCRKDGVSSIELYSNRKLKNALHLYRKFGFKEISIPPDSPYERADIRMICPLYN